MQFKNIESKEKWQLTYVFVMIPINVIYNQEFFMNKPKKRIDVSLVKKLLSLGFSRKDIAKELDVNVSSIYRVLDREKEKMQQENNGNIENIIKNKINYEEIYFYSSNNYDIVFSCQSYYIMQRRWW